jgi:hypothetical protein
MAHKSETETAMPLLNISLKSDPHKLVDALKRRPLEIVNAIENRLNIILLQLSQYIVTQKLSGQVLHRRTGALANAVHVNPARVVGATIRGEVTAAGSPASLYGRVHETGGNAAYDIFSVRGRALRFVSGAGETVFAKHVRHPAAMMRPFMRPALEENAASIREQLQEAIDAELQD